ncbi:cytosolic sulfotransferase 3-like isoform X1 [Entelurus aequoreus]|uniref:cytosolic sulfotransferase 3-like isoform X1 n=1 Tax=Entelurus aequoreus TaxID=161455 RepID=UPI002B1D2D52|nr:cytosolic sulfotransferase 3-like isoform X1 [Entelurus aequoreus]XP_061909588.1 cytosolic sulfotransferase 3-like isoform X1 [Entelurus aequoreus]
MDSSFRPALFDFHGVSMTHYFTDNWDNVQNFQARPDDILIATYPKAGTTWVSCILDLLHFGQTSSERQTSISIYDRVPFLEMSVPSVPKGTELVDKLVTSPRLIKTHFPVQFVPKSFWEQNCRIVYLARNAKDSVVSYFHFDRMNMAEPEPGEWSSFLQRFMQGKSRYIMKYNYTSLPQSYNAFVCLWSVVFGSWYDHVNGWWKKKQTYSKLHYMFYEDLIEDTGRELDKLCSFVGLSPSDEHKKSIIGTVQFDNMKKNKMANHSTISIMDFKISHFMRKGKVGDWKNHFTVNQNEHFDEDYKKKMTDLTLEFRTEMDISAI